MSEPVNESLALQAAQLAVTVVQAVQTDLARLRMEMDALRTEVAALKTVAPPPALLSPDVEQALRQQSRDLPAPMVRMMRREVIARKVDGTTDDALVRYIFAGAREDG